VAPATATCRTGAGKRKADAVEDEEAEVEVDDGVEEKAEAELKALLVRQSGLAYTLPL
jgi:hypothetical protein